MTLPLKLLRLLMLGVLLTSCDLRGNASELGSATRPSAFDSQVFVATFAGTSQDSTGALTLEMSAPDNAFGVSLCDGTGPNALEHCRAGRGAFLTSDYQRLLNGRRIYRANIPMMPREGGRIVAVAYDSSGALLGSSTIELRGR